MFGTGEGIYEMALIDGRSPLVLLFAALMTHTVMGLGYLINGRIWPGLVIALILHSGWNTAVYLKK
jgi:hypothetical protein